MKDCLFKKFAAEQWSKGDCSFICLFSQHPVFYILGTVIGVRKKQAKCFSLLKALNTVKEKDTYTEIQYNMCVSFTEGCTKH